MNAPANCRLIGRWRIVEADLWDRAHLDLCGPARLAWSRNERFAESIRRLCQTKIGKCNLTCGSRD